MVRTARVRDQRGGGQEIRLKSAEAGASSNSVQQQDKQARAACGLHEDLGLFTSCVDAAATGLRCIQRRSELQTSPVSRAEVTWGREPETQCVRG